MHLREKKPLAPMTVLSDNIRVDPQLQFDLQDLYAERSDYQRDIRAAATQYNLALAGLLVGLLLFIFTTWYWLSALLILAGLLAALTQRAKKQSLLRDIAAVDQEIEFIRSQIE